MRLKAVPALAASVVLAKALLVKFVIVFNAPVEMGFFPHLRARG
jgi:hypothetical protein